MFDSIPFIQNVQFLLRFRTQSGPAGDVLIQSFHLKGFVSIAFQRPEWSSGSCLNLFLLFKTVSFYCFSAPRVVQREMFESIPFIQNTQFLLRFSAQSGPAATPSIQNAQFLLCFSAWSGPAGGV